MVQASILGKNVGTRSGTIYYEYRVGEGRFEGSFQQPREQALSYSKGDVITVYVSKSRPSVSTFSIEQTILLAKMRCWGLAVTTVILVGTLIYEARKRKSQSSEVLT